MADLDRDVRNMVSMYTRGRTQLDVSLEALHKFDSADQLKPSNKQV